MALGDLLVALCDDSHDNCVYQCEKHIVDLFCSPYRTMQSIHNNAIPSTPSHLSSSLLTAAFILVT